MFLLQRFKRSTDPIIIRFFIQNYKCLIQIPLISLLPQYIHSRRLENIIVIFELIKVLPNISKLFRTLIVKSVKHFINLCIFPIKFIPIKLSLHSSGKIIQLSLIAFLFKHKTKLLDPSHFRFSLQRCHNPLNIPNLSLSAIDIIKFRFID